MIVDMQYVMNLSVHMQRVISMTIRCKNMTRDMTISHMNVRCARIVCNVL